ncbi:hypothetical protein [Marasmitruncus massiliensis]|uniref:hypothetical protein n=1 Tax=Marasmitruncus massiliensis TaxID=1944642 RepID=UPI000C7DAE27|nr:hypothetical protein [Marasmitruncus massiliensis]
MQYREMGKTGDKISILAYGCMRFPKDGNRIDEARTERQVISAIERGVNYFAAIDFPKTGVQTNTYFFAAILLRNPVTDAVEADHAVASGDPVFPTGICPAFPVAVVPADPLWVILAVESCR